VPRDSCRMVMVVCEICRCEMDMVQSKHPQKVHTLYEDLVARLPISSHMHLFKNRSLMKAILFA